MASDTTKVREDRGVPVTKIRGFRIEDPVYLPAQATAREQREALADFVRRALIAYAADPTATNIAIANIRGAGE